MAKRKAEFKVTTVFTLPSGNVAEVKPVTLVDLAKRGAVPQNLVGAATEMTNRKASESLNLEQMGEFAQLVDLIAMSCFVDPRLVPDDQDPDEDSLRVGDVGFHDKLAVMQWADKAAGALTPFREEQAREPQSL